MLWHQLAGVMSVAAGNNSNIPQYAFASQNVSPQHHYHHQHNYLFSHKEHNGPIVRTCEPNRVSRPIYTVPKRLVPLRRSFQLPLSRSCISSSASADKLVNNLDLESLQSRKEAFMPYACEFLPRSLGLTQPSANTLAGYFTTLLPEIFPSPQEGLMP